MQELLDILRCPETHQPFQMADASLIADLNGKIKANQLNNRAGKPITEPIDNGLIREDRKFLYPIRNNIPVLLIDEAIPLQ
jgi:uncharacterized protein YbaR (Trm112 family)